MNISILVLCVVSCNRPWPVVTRRRWKSRPKLRGQPKQKIQQTKVEAENRRNGSRYLLFCPGDPITSAVSSFSASVQFYEKRTHHRPSIIRHRCRRSLDPSVRLHLRRISTNWRNGFKIWQNHPSKRRERCSSQWRLGCRQRTGPRDRPGGESFG